VVKEGEDIGLLRRRMDEWEERWRGGSEGENLKGRKNHLTLMAWPRSEAWCISFLGMQPTLTQVPPSPQVLPIEGGGRKNSVAGT
jgi:hypothetical protein